MASGVKRGWWEITGRMRRRGNVALRDMHRLLNAAEAIAHAGSWSWRPPNRLMWSRGMYPIFGFAPGRPPRLEQFLERIHPDDRANIDAYLTRAMEGVVEERETEYRVLAPDGEVRTIAAVTDVRTDARGKLIEIIGAVQDVTERKRIEDALRKALEDRQTAVSAGNVGFWERDLVHDTTTYSTEYVQQLGYSRSEFGEGVEAWRSKVHPDDLAGADERIRRFLKSSESFAQYEFRLRHKDGGYRWILTQASAIRDERGRALRLVGCHLDITEKKEAEAERLNLQAQLEQAQRLQAIGTLAGGVAHDFNNLLLAISGNAQLALEDCAPDHPAYASLLEIRQATGRAAALVRSLLTFSRASVGEKHPLQVQPVIAEALRLLRAAIPPMIAIRFTPPEKLPNVSADAGQLHQIVMNLGANAAHAIGQRIGAIEVSVGEFLAREEDARRCADLHNGAHYVRIAMADDGAGMSKEIVDRVFEPFFTTKPAGVGTGLGLSVVHGIVKNHGGAIEIDSEPGRGARVAIYLPITEDVATPSDPLAAPAQGGAGKRVLYIDDEDVIVTLMSRLLGRLQYRVTAFTDPLLAIDDFRQRPKAFDVVVTDLSMPTMSGFDAAREILQIRPDIPVIITSGYVRPEDAQQAARIGVKAVLLKPNTLEEMARELYAIFSASQASP